MNLFQKAVLWMASKAAGFPIWTGSTADIPPGGWRSIDPLGGYSGLLDVPSFRGCSRVLGQAMGSLPFNVFTEDATGLRQKAVDHETYPILHDSPNALMTSMELRQAMMLDYCIAGNGYAQIVKLGKRVVAINPLFASRMRPLHAASGFVYRYTNFDGKPHDFQPEEIIHIKNPSSGGLIGLPHVPHGLLQRALDTQAYGANFMRNQGRPSGVLSSEQAAPANEEVAKRERQEWESKFSGAVNAGRTAVLYRGMKYQAISGTPEEAQYNETMKQLNAEFAGIFGVPLNLIDQTDKTATYASAEQFDIQFVKHVARPLAVMIEQAFNKKLFFPVTTPRLFCELDLDGLLRGDTQSQAQYFATVHANAGLSSNEWRRKMNLPQSKDPMADELMIQSNMIPLRLAGEVAVAAKSQPVTQPTGAAQ